MDVYTCVRERSTVRQFSPDPIPESLINKLLLAARWAPSSRNRQPWHLIVVKDEVVVKKLGLFRSQLNQTIDLGGAPPLFIVVVFVRFFIVIVFIRYRFSSLSLFIVVVVPRRRFSSSTRLRRAVRNENSSTPTAAFLHQQHAIAVTVKSHALGNCPLIGSPHVFVLRECRHQHQQSRTRQMKIRQQHVDRTRRVRRVQKNSRRPGTGLRVAVI